MVSKVTLISVLSLVGFGGFVPVFAQDTSPTPAVQVGDVAADARAIWEADPTTILDGAGLDLDDFRWIARPVVVFADSPEDPAFLEQIELLRAQAGDLATRDVAIIADTDPGTLSDIRRRLRPRGFQLVLIGKDGGVKLRKPFPWDVRELTRVIDGMPIRQREIRESR
ncbi:DUF4174 domain-containing protein [Palleronia rufa]